MRHFSLARAATGLVATTAFLFLLAGTSTTDAVYAATAKNLTRTGYIYTYPIMLTYREMYADIIAKGPPYKFNQFVIQDKLPDPKTAGPNADVDFLTATAWLDTRDNPVVLTVPEPDRPDRYMSVQTTHMKGYETDYVSTRMSGMKDVSARYYIQSPATVLKTDPGGMFKNILYSDSDFTRVQARVGPITSPADVTAAKNLLGEFKVTPLPDFLLMQIGSESKLKPKASTPSPTFYKWNDDMLKGGNNLEWINFLNWVLPYVKIHKGNETQFIKDMGVVGVNAGKYTELSMYPPATLEAMEEGVKEGYAFMYDPANAARFAGTDKLAEGYYDVFNYEQHAVSSVIGEKGVFTPSAWETEAFGKDFPEAMPGDSYILKFDKNKIPGVNEDGAGFWSITAYSLPDRKLVPNALDRYSIQSTNPDLVYNKDGSLEIYMQANAPPADQQGNWLPIPANGPFGYVLRINGPGGNAKPISELKAPLRPDAVSPVAIRAATGGPAAVTQAAAAAAAAAAVVLPPPPSVVATTATAAIGPQTPPKKSLRV